MLLPARPRTDHRPEAGVSWCPTGPHLSLILPVPAPTPARNEEGWDPNRSAGTRVVWGPGRWPDLAHTARTWAGRHPLADDTWALAPACGPRCASVKSSLIAVRIRNPGDHQLQAKTANAAVTQRGAAGLARATRWGAGCGRRAGRCCSAVLLPRREKEDGRAGGGASRLGIWCSGVARRRRVGLLVSGGVVGTLLLLGSSRAVRACWRGARDVVGPALHGDRVCVVGLLRQLRARRRPRFASRPYTVSRGFPWPAVDVWCTPL